MLQGFGGGITVIGTMLILVVLLMLMLSIFFSSVSRCSCWCRLFGWLDGWIILHTPWDKVEACRETITGCRGNFTSISFMSERHNVCFDECGKYHWNRNTAPLFFGDKITSFGKMMFV